MNFYQHHIGDFSKGIKISSLPMVYVLATHDLSLIKIGMTISPKQRFINIQSGCPYVLFPWLSIRTPKPREVESFLHEKFKEYKLRGEWFSLSGRNLDLLIDLITLTNAEIRRVHNALL